MTAYFSTRPSLGNKRGLSAKREALLDETRRPLNEFRTALNEFRTALATFTLAGEDCLERSGDAPRLWLSEGHQAL